MTFYRILIKTVFLTLVFSCSNKITVIHHNSETKYTDYLIRTQKLDFSINDTIIETEIYVRPDGTFYFAERPDQNFENKIITSITSTKSVGDSIIIYREKLIDKNQDIITLKSYFPPLLIHDSSVIIHYDIIDDWNFGFKYEMRYSNILTNLKEPIIREPHNNLEIRVVLPVLNYKTNFHSYKPVTYSSIRLKIDKGVGIIYYSESQYDTLANFNIPKKDSAAINKRYLKKITKLIKNTDFEKENYFAQVGIDYDFPYLIEIRENDNYYVFERSYVYNKYTNDKQLNQIALSLIRLKSKYID